jgi:uncharacterized protein (DUF3820 family)
METSILKFGKYKGQDFYSTPKSYQNWLLSQDWFKAPKQAADLWNVVVIFEREYAMATGCKSETLHYNLSFEDAKDLKEAESYNIYDGVDYYTVIQVKQ